LALNYFKLAAQSGNANAMAYLGKMYAGDSSAVTPSNKDRPAVFHQRCAKWYAWPPSLTEGRTEFSVGQIRRAGLRGGPAAAGLMHYTGITRPGIRDPARGFGFLACCRCQTPAGVLEVLPPPTVVKNVAERGRWSDQLMEAHRLYKGGIRQRLCRPCFAICFWPTRYEIPRRSSQPTSPILGQLRQLWPAAGQSYAQARLKLADYHYYGLGGPANLEQAASLYRAASDQQSSAQAMFNLAYMYERGLGLERDLHLAKRYYDQAAEASADAYMPVMLALCRLAVEFVMDYLRGGNYSVADLISLLSFSNFWPSATLPPPEQQRAGQHQAEQAAYDEDGESPDSANQQRQYSMAAGSRSGIPCCSLSLLACSSTCSFDSSIGRPIGGRLGPLRPVRIAITIITEVLSSGLQCLSTQIPLDVFAYIYMLAVCIPMFCSFYVYCGFCCFLLNC
uniref:Death ligand signal enhancer n=1 Tax=Macrostomum lignano TaxID=282301 RepID=A0A1I8F2C7_9PLAT